MVLVLSMSLDEALYLYQGSQKSLRVSEFLDRHDFPSELFKGA